MIIGAAFLSQRRPSCIAVFILSVQYSQVKLTSRNSAGNSVNITCGEGQIASKWIRLGKKCLQLDLSLMGG